VAAHFPANSSTERLVRFKPVTLVPYEPKLIDRSRLSLEQASWLAGYNKQVYETVGLAFKKAGNHRAFKWVEARTGPF
jgi:Xaa-Pro aminopeptidase